MTRCIQSSLLHFDCAFSFNISKATPWEIFQMEKKEKSVIFLS